MSFDNAIYQWQQGERRLRSGPPDRAARLERVIEALVAELRRRLGGRFSIDELVELYGAGTAWCLAVAMREAADILRALNSDPLYIRLCQAQECFRARVTPAAA